MPADVENGGRPGEAVIFYSRYRSAIHSAPKSWAIVHKNFLGREVVEKSPPLSRRGVRVVFGDRSATTVRELFDEYAERWRSATAFTSSVTEAVLDLDYQKIIGLGMPAVPHIISALRAEPEHWFWALVAITGEDQAVGCVTVEEARQAWIRWYDAEFDLI